MIVVVSPHLDDAALSCWSVVDGGGDVSVLTVFTGAPEPGFVSEWDADTGVDSATRMAQRIAEDRAALAIAGATSAHLGLPEVQYGGGTVSAEQLEPHLVDADAVYVPAATAVVKPNDEHRIVRDAALALRPDAHLYADQPYSQFRADLPSPPWTSHLVRKLVVLHAEQRRRKVEALRCYAGEVPKLERAFGAFLTPERLGHELFWTPA